MKPIVSKQITLGLLQEYIKLVIQMANIAHLNSGLSKTCLKNLCKYEAIQTSQAALRVHMYSIFKNQSTQLNFVKI